MIDILVPVLGRPGNAKKVYESAHNGRFFFICSPGDDHEIEACLQTGAEVLIVPWEPGPGDYAKKINWAVGFGTNPWIFTGADDISFHPGWDTAALRNGARVVGTNDLHNPTVRAGRAATHFLIARSWVEEQGQVFCEEYDHWYVDKELVDVARSQDEWGFAEDSVVEHLHPHWGLAEQDDTYRKGTKRVRQDASLYQQRRRLLRR